MVILKDNFLSTDICESLINFFENDANRHNKHVNIKRDTINLDLNLDEDFFKRINLKENLNTVTNFFYNSIIDWIQIVKWPTNSFHRLHFDISSKETTLASICYLNDDFKGGQTYFEDGTIFYPKQNRIIFFDGNCYLHGVKQIETGTRYVLAAWYKKNIFNKNALGI